MREPSSEGDGGQETSHGDPWPSFLCVRSHVVVTNTLTVVLVTFFAVLALDVVQVVGPREIPLWSRIYNDGPIEWMQWFFQAFIIATAAYIGSYLRLRGDDLEVGRFYWLLALGVGLMLIEDAGDIRHELAPYIIGLTGPEIVGLPVNLFAEVPYFMLIAALPVYAVMRYGRYVWRVPSVRRYLLPAFALYGLAAAASSLRVLGDTYVRTGYLIDAHVFGGRSPAAPGQTRSESYFYLVDGMLEESMETIAAACMFAMVLAHAAHLRQREVMAGGPSRGAERRVSDV